MLAWPKDKMKTHRSGFLIHLLNLDRTVAAGAGDGAVAEARSGARAAAAGSRAAGAGFGRGGGTARRAAGIECGAVLRRGGSGARTAHEQRLRICPNAAKKHLVRKVVVFRRFMG
jgi:hypothetical protein